MGAEPVKPEPSNPEPAAEIPLLVFSVGGQSMAVSVENTEGVVDCPRISPLPTAPEQIIGVTSVRGRITLVVELCAEATPTCARRRLILLKGDSQVGLVADRVEGIVAAAVLGIRPLSGQGQTRKRKQAIPDVDRQTRPFCRKYFMAEGRKIPIVDMDLVSAM
jgi:chemotaxis signal transduction protein